MPRLGLGLGLAKSRVTESLDLATIEFITAAGITDPAQINAEGLNG